MTLVTPATAILEAVRAAAAESAAGQFYQERRSERRKAMDPRKWLFGRNTDDGQGWDAVRTDCPFEALELYRERIRSLLEDSNANGRRIVRDYTDEIAAVEAYMCSHSHRFPDEEVTTGAALMDFVWVYLCYLYGSHTTTHLKVRAFRDAIRNHGTLALAAAADEEGPKVLLKELRRRMLTFHLGGATDRLSFVHPTYIKEEEERRKAFVVAKQAPLDASKQRSLLAIPDPPTEEGEEKDEEEGTRRADPSSLPCMLRSATNIEFLLACAAHVAPTRKEKLATTTTFVTWSGQYAWCVLFKRALSTVHTIVPRLLPEVEHAEVHFRRWLMSMSEFALTSSQAELRDFFVFSFAPAGFSLRAKRHDSTKQRAALLTRAVDDLKLILDNTDKTNNVIDTNVQQLITTRQNTPAAMYLRTPAHPGHDRFAFFYFALQFKSRTGIDFFKRYLFMGDHGISGPPSLWRIIARRPSSDARSPFLPIIIEYGGDIAVRLAGRMYRCQTLVQAAITWCVLTHRYFQQNEQALMERKTECGVDISEFLSQVLPRMFTSAAATNDVKDDDDDNNNNNKDTRAHLLAELADTRYAHGTSDTDDEDQLQNRRRGLIAKLAPPRVQDAATLHRQKLIAEIQRVKTGVVAARAPSSSPSSSSSSREPIAPAHAAAAASAASTGAANPSMTHRAKPFRKRTSSSLDGDGDESSSTHDDDSSDKFRKPTAARRAERHARRQRASSASMNNRRGGGGADSIISEHEFRNRRPLLASLSPQHRPDD